MSETKVLESGIKPLQNTQNQSNGYAESMVSLLTRSNPEKAVGEAIDHLIAKRTKWESNELSSANDALYGLLQHCYMLNNAMIGGDTMAKNLRKGLGNYITTKGYKFTDATPLITKVIRCVFGVDRRRVNAYASALRVAIAEKVSVMDLPKYLRDSGGIEEVRRKNGKPTKSMKDKVELGRAVLSSNAIVNIQSDTLNAAYSTSSTEEGVVLLATKEDDGSFAIRQVVQSGTAVKTALAACASVGAEKEKARQVEKDFQAIEDERAAAQAALKAA
jgi:hypothetical protein